VIPESVDQIEVEEFDIEKIRYSYIEHVMKMTDGHVPIQEDIVFLAEDSKSSFDFVRETMKSLNVKAASSS